MKIEEWLGENNEVGHDICKNKYRWKNETLDEMFTRVSGGNKQVEKAIRELIFLYGGRAMSNRGTGKNASYSNCYSIGYVPDDFKGILGVIPQIGMTYKAQGGQGLSLSKIRPKGCKVGSNFKSDGFVPFMRMYDVVTAGTSQGGARKGALLMSLDCMHKDVADFITIKSDTDEINKANLSVEVSDEFMEAVSKYFETGEIVKIDVKRTYGSEQIEYTVTPIEVYKLMMRQAYDFAEPGVIYTNRFRNYNLMEFCDDYIIETGNPCGEQSLPKHGACCLGSINLSRFVVNPFTAEAYFDFDKFMWAVRTGVDGLNKLLDEGIPLHALPEQRAMARNYRNIGLGEMGLADALIKLKYCYGSKESKVFVDELGRIFFREAVLRSCELAERDGPFPSYTPELFNSKIIQSHFSKEEIEKMRKIGLRNCSLLSIAPTGSIGTMANVSTGIEPLFAFSYNRKTESLHKDKEQVYKVLTGVVQEYIDLVPGGDADNLPDYFVSSADIAWKDRIDVQATLQNHIDTAISSTVNIPYETSMEEIEQLYLYGWKQGLKGITIYRDGCARAGILTNDKQSEQTDEENNRQLGRGDIIDCSNDLIGKKRKLTTGCGNIHCMAWFDPITGDLMETFIPKGGTGGCRCNTDAVSRLISLSSRGGICIESVVDQLSSCTECGSYTRRTGAKHDTSKGSSCPSACAYAILDMHNEVLEDLGLIETETQSSKDAPKQKEIKTTEKSKPIPCPDCGEPLHFEGGCNICPSCGWSKCG